MARLMVGWIFCTLAVGLGGMWGLFALASEVRLLRLFLEAK